MATNLFQDLKDALQKFKDFLDQNTPVIKPAIQALAKVIPQISDLITKLVDLMGKLKTEIQSLSLPGDVGAVFDKVTGFTGAIKTLLTTAESLLPDEKSAIDDVLGVTDVVSSLPSLGDIKDQISQLIDDIVGNLNSLKPA